MTTGILWFRRDLRLTDNPAVRAALTTCERVLPVFVYAPDEEAPWQPGAASRWWLHHSLSTLAGALRERGSGLILARGPSLESLRGLAARTCATHVFWNRLYDPATLLRDKRIKSDLQESGLVCSSHNAALLSEPWSVQTLKGTPFRVFTAYWRACSKGPADMDPPTEAPRELPPLPDEVPSLALRDLGLLPAIPWDTGLAENWNPGEEGALRALSAFLNESVEGYASRRDYPSTQGTSRLSPHLHFGEIGPRQVRWVLRNRSDDTLSGSVEGDSAAFLRQLGWREFSCHLLYHFPETQERSLDPRFALFPWSEHGRAEARIRSWREGRTGIPIVDAGMRELWHTGWMHNRVRMIVASLLVKNLRCHWLTGARWFWDTLVDADLPNNTQGWQWTAGCGADAAPYFRIFNPVLQGERFDAEGAYVRRWVPELTRLPDKHLHKPWTAGNGVLRDTGVRLGIDYPNPIVDLALSRRAALEAWARIRDLQAPTG